MVLIRRVALSGLVAVLAACSGGDVDRVSLAERFEAVGLEFDELEMETGGTSWHGQSADGTTVDLDNDPVTRIAIAFIDINGADIRDTDFQGFRGCRGGGIGRHWPAPMGR